MKIGIYVETAKDAEPTGIGLHVRNLLDALAALDGDNEYLLYHQRNLTQRKSHLPFVPEQRNFQARPVRAPARWQWNRPRLWWDWYLPRILKRDGVDVFHGPNHFLPAFERRKNLVTIHDVAYFHMDVYPRGQDAMLRDWTRKALNRAGGVIALSENTRRDLEGLGVESERIRVIYGGGHIVPDAGIQWARTAELKQVLSLPAKYILFVGTLQPRKNVPFLLRSFARLKQQAGLPHKLVLAGQRGSAAAEIEELIQQLGIAADVLITGYLDEWQLPLLYKMADLFVLPTRYEGFTLVTLEAMAYGVPVIATDTSSLREGVGDAGLLVQVDNVDELALAMQRVLTNESLRKELIARGEVQARKFTWENCARETLAFYQDLHRTSSPRALQTAAT